MSYPHERPVCGIENGSITWQLFKKWQDNYIRIYFVIIFEFINAYADGQLSHFA